ncbi:MAG: OadG family protein [Promethearchaeota archaeon]
MFAIFSIDALLNSLFIGLIIAVLGMGLTFLALGGVVIGTIVLKNLILKFEMKRQKTPNSTPKESTEGNTIKEPLAKTELIAVISAAVTAYLGTSKFRISSVSPASPRSKSAWGRTARLEQIRPKKLRRWK